MTDSHVLECVVFETTAGVGRDEFVSAANAITEWARSQRGFIDRELYEVGDGRWIDVVRWATLEDAHAAAEQIGSAPGAGEFMSRIDGPTVQMMHATPTLTRA